MTTTSLVPLHPPAAAWPWERLPARHQPEWHTHARYLEISRELAERAPLVSFPAIDALTGKLAQVARGEALLLQAGDCAERLDECSPGHVAEKISALRDLADHLEGEGELPVVQVGRIAGQFGKPRSSPVERYDQREVLTFRGHMINDDAPNDAARKLDPARMLAAYQASACVLDVLNERRAHEASHGGGPWASHEALVLDYETPLVRRGAPDGRPYLTSTHLPWIGERTRQCRLAHVRLMAEIANPVGCKLGPDVPHANLERLCAMLDPDRRPGRLVLIPRLGRAHVERVLPQLVRRVRRAGHRPVWLCDPLHGNTRLAANKLKTRSIDDVIYEVRAFCAVLERHGEHPGGLHLETSTTEVGECVDGSPEHAHVARAPLCDPRLSPRQATRVLDAWLDSAPNGRL
jgi:3-deoxy-7-phosphoheptulonate synthase